MGQEEAPLKFDLKITLAVATALLAAGCEQQKPTEWTASNDTQLCVDKDGKRIPDSNCQNRRPGENHMASGAAMGFAAWYFLGRGGRIPMMGDAVRGGSFTARPGAAYGRAAGFTSVNRGGFGGSSRSISGFGRGAGE